MSATTKRGQTPVCRTVVPTVVGNLAVEALGEGPAVLAWPVLFGDSESWRPVLEPLAASHRVLLVDPPGHGASGPAARRYSLADCAAAAAQVLDAFEVERADVVGHAFGGKVALRLAALHPDRVGKLVVLTTISRPQPLVARIQARALAAFLALLGTEHALVRKLIGDTVLSKGAPREDLARSLARLDRRSAVLGVHAVLLEQDSRPEDAAGLMPGATAVVATGDTAFRPGAQHELAGRLPAAFCVEVPGGHLLHIEQPDAVRDAIADALAGPGRESS